LLEKYKGLKFYDAKYNVYQTVCFEGLEWRTRDRRNSNSYTGWYIICQDDDGEETPWYICQSLCTFISKETQPDGVKVVCREGAEEEEGSDEEEE
jgi:hypothetical protein